MYTAYLDTCIVGLIVNKAEAGLEQNAAIKLLQLYEKTKLNLVTSDTTLAKINKIPIDFRSNHKNIFLVLKNIPVCQQKRVMDLIGMGIIPFPREEPLFTKLKSIIPGDADRQHIFNALVAKCQYFITTDIKTILIYRKTLEKEFNGFLALKPSEAVSLFCTEGS